MGGELLVHGMYGNSILQFSLLQNECVFSICKLFFKRKLILIPVRFLVEVNFRILIKTRYISFRVSQNFILGFTKILETLLFPTMQTQFSTKLFTSHNSILCSEFHSTSIHPTFKARKYV